jgi:hypothetical protein
MPLIVNTTNGTIGTPGGAEQLLPGANETTSELCVFLRSIPYFQSLLRQGILTIEDDAPAAPPPTVEGSELPASLKGRPMAEVRSVIAQCTDRARLLRWLSTDGRKETRSLLEARANELEVINGDAKRPGDPVS